MKKSRLMLIALAVCLLCLSVVSAATLMTNAGTVPSGSTGQTAISSGLPLLKAQEEETTTETTMEPVTYPTEQPTEQPTLNPTEVTTQPTEQPTLNPTEESTQPTEQPTLNPTEESTQPTEQPTLNPTEETIQPTELPTVMPITEETTSPIPGPYAPVASFTASPASGTGPLTVRFTDTSLNTPTMWYWDFGDGTTDSSTGVPTHTYTDPGTYTVTMTATNMYGSDTITETDLVTVNGQVMNNGAIFAQSIPAGAMIYVNGNSYGTSPVTINNLFPGTYTVQASLNGYSPDTRTVSVYSGRTTGYYPTMQPTPYPPMVTGAVYAQSTPAGAGIYLNGVYYGNSPLTINNLFPGTYSILATLSGYAANAQSITVTQSHTSGFYPTLQPSPGPETTGDIFAQSTPAGAAIYVNSQYFGISPLTIPDLAPGTYIIKAMLNGYADDIQRITVSPGHVSIYTPAFYPSPPPIGSGQGIIAVYCNVDGAQVYFDNAFEGNVSNGVLFVPVATTGTPVQSYRVQNTGYIPYTGSITQWPANGETVKVTATLVPSSVPTTHTPLPVPVTIGALIGAGAVFLIARKTR
ncbi:MAG: PEGA domain-containing protein [Methanoregula sp.]|uniref:PEGA domain-containing protein n=2 Tax=Methanoregula sp. TaxID=2052170 RepID=UPI003BB0C4CA